MRDLLLTRDIVQNQYYNSYSEIKYSDFLSQSGDEAKIDSVTEEPDGSVRIKGTVKTSYFRENAAVTAVIDPERGRILSTYCSCFGSQKHTIRESQHVVCAHVRALLFRFIAECEDMQWPYRPKQRSSNVLASALKALGQHLANEAVDNATDGDEPDGGDDISLSYSFGAGDGGYSTRIGMFYASVQAGAAGARKFVVKDLKQFIDDAWSHNAVTFGKGTTLHLNWEKLAPLDRSILETISSSMIRMNKLSGLEKKPNGKFFMTEAGFARIVRLFHDNEIPFVFEGQESRIAFDYPSLKLEIEKVHWDSVLLSLCTGNGHDTEIFQYGNSVAFYDRGDSIFFLPDLDKPLKMVFSMFESPGSLLLAPDDFVPFCQNLLPIIRKFASVEGLENLGDVKLPQKPQLKLYLDSDRGEYSMIGRATAAYDEGEVDIFSDAPCSFLRNSLEENRFAALCRQTLKAQTFERDVHLYSSFSSEEEFYSVLAHVADSISPFGDVLVSSALSNKMPSRPRVSFASGISSSGVMLLDMKVEQEVLDQLGEIIAAYKLKKRYFKLKTGKALCLEDESFESLSTLSDVLPFSEGGLSSGHLEIPSYRALYVDAVLKGTEGLEYQRSDTFKSLVRSIRDWEDNSMAIPKTVNATLRSYQEKGCQWLMSLAENGLGGILADDMGLGKTLEMLTVFAAYKSRHKKLAALVVAPASLLLNWVGEMHRFTPALKGVALLGSATERKKLLEEGADVIVTSYDLIRRDEALFAGRHFDFLVLDEAQTIRNEQTKVSKAVKGIDAAHRFALTGTPIQNRLSDLWSIFDFLMPGFLFTHAEFKKRWETPAGKKNGDVVLERLKKITSPFVLRRLKSNVLRELPQKTVSVRTVQMESEQNRLYQANYVMARKEFAQLVKKQGLNSSKIQILALLTRLRQICCDPGLLYDNYDGDSAKISSVMELVQEAVDGGHSILLFSQFTSMLDILQKKLQSENIAYYRIDGATSKEKRQEYVDRFQSDDTPVFLISLKAGGLGLNLTKADTIIIYDPWWNVAQEEQACDRAYRMGQKRSVQVYRLICENSIEEKIQLIQEKKKQLIEGVLCEGELQPVLDEADWMSLFS